MNSIKSRIEKIEKHTGNREQITIIVCHDHKSEPTEEQTEAAIADFKVRCPNWKAGLPILLSWKDSQYQNFPYGQNVT